jgi:uncharacterized membrane protein
LETFIVFIFVPVCTAVAVIKGYVWVPAPVIIAAIIIGALVTQKSEENLPTDERTVTITEKGPGNRPRIYVIFAAPIGLTLAVLGHSNHSYLEPVAYTLAISSGNY